VKKINKFQFLLVLNNINQLGLRGFFSTSSRPQQPQQHQQHQQQQPQQPFQFTSNSTIGRSLFHKRSRVHRLSVFPLDMTVKSSLVITSSDRRLLDLWPVDADATSMASGLCLLSSNNVVAPVANPVAQIAASLYHFALRVDVLTALAKLSDPTLDNVLAEQTAMMQWNDSVLNAFALLRARAERADGAMDWFQVYHEKMCISFEFDAVKRSIVAVIGRSRPGLRAALRTAGVMFAMPCAPDIDVAERKAEILRLQLLVNGGGDGDGDGGGDAVDDADATRVADIKEAIQLQSLSTMNNGAAIPDVAAALAGTEGVSESSVSTALVVEGVDAVSRLLQFFLALPRDNESHMRAPAPFLRCSLQSGTVERCSAVQVANQASPRRSPRRRLETMMPSTTTTTTTNSQTKSPPRSPMMKQHFRLAIRGPVCATALKRLLDVVASHTSDFVAQMVLENKTGGFNAWRGRDEAIQHSFARTVSMESDRQWRVTVDDAAIVDIQ
jgi:hypothetical protein